MNKATTQISLNADRTAVLMEVLADEEIVGSVELPAPEADELIKALASDRARLRDKVPPSLDPNARLNASPRPAVRIDNYVTQDLAGIVLSLRHPGLGWISFLMPNDQALDLAARIQRYVENQEAPPSHE